MPGCWKGLFGICGAAWRVVNRVSLVETAAPLAQIMLNPFHGPATKITNKVFDQKVKISARKYLA